MRGGDGEGQGETGLKSLNPSLSLPVVRAKILPHPRPTAFAGRGKPARGEARRGGLSEAWKNCNP